MSLEECLQKRNALPDVDYSLHSNVVFNVYIWRRDSGIKLVVPLPSPTKCPASYAQIGFGGPKLQIPQTRCLQGSAIGWCEAQLLECKTPSLAKLNTPSSWNPSSGCLAQCPESYMQTGPGGGPQESASMEHSPHHGCHDMVSNVVQDLESVCSVLRTIPCCPVITFQACRKKPKLAWNQSVLSASCDKHDIQSESWRILAVEWSLKGSGSGGL